MSLAQKTTTNNVAEYTGVLTGLRAAAERHWFPLEVVGDSQLILRQLREYRQPKNQRLLQLYNDACRLGDTIGVRHWHHHLREFNKMADAAANVAMDLQASSQVTHPTDRVDHRHIEQHLAQDFTHWQENYFIRNKPQ